jgi:uncharacterized membrane protein (UPF0127 family)
VNAAPAAPDATGPAPGSGTSIETGGARARNETRGTTLADEIETASSLWGKFMGLMGRRSLASGRALWLPNENGIHMFFMRFPIDAVFVGRAGPDGTRPVLSTHRGLRPWTGIVPLVRGAAGVLELPVGSIDASGTVPGDTVRVG